MAGYDAFNRNVALEEAIADLHVQIANQKATIVARNEEIGKLNDVIAGARRDNRAYAIRLDEILNAVGEVCILARKPVI